MVMPNFLIIGAAKSGTTALYNYLFQHPEIYLSDQKETNFFANEDKSINFAGPGDEGSSQRSIRDLSSYQSLFEKVTNEKAVGEASPLYLYSRDALINIKRHIPDTKLIVILRNPTERAFSSYLHLIRDGRETMSFEEGLDLELERINKQYAQIWHYKKSGLYNDQLLRYYKLFEKEQIKVYIYDDFKQNPEAIFKDLFTFLEVDNSFEPNMNVKHNVSGMVNNKFIQNTVIKSNFFKSILKPLLPIQVRANLKAKIVNKHLTKPIMLADTRSTLIDYFRSDILQLEKLIDKDLSHWLE